MCAYTCTVKWIDLSCKSNKLKPQQQGDIKSSLWKNGTIITINMGFALLLSASNQLNYASTDFG